MRKVRISRQDFDMFDTDISVTEFEFIHRHWDAFRRMWKEQGQKFWINFIVTFRNFAKEFGVIREMPEFNEKYVDLIDQTFIFLHEQFIEAKYQGAKTLLQEILTLAQNKGTIQFLGSKSFAKDPFYNKETRDCFRHLFGPPNEKLSYLKVCVLHDVYTRFAGAICKCLKRWLEAEEMDPNDESFWTDGATCGQGAEPEKMEPLAGGEICNECGHVIGDEPVRQFSDTDFVTFLLEKQNGKLCGPWFLPGWPLHEDPRYFDPQNPLYDLNQDPEIDWRSELSFTKFVSFSLYVKQKYGGASSSAKDQKVTKIDENTNAMVQRLFEAGAGEALVNSISSPDGITLENLVKVLEVADSITEDRTGLSSRPPEELELLRSKLIELKHAGEQEAIREIEAKHGVKIVRGSSIKTTTGKSKDTDRTETESEEELSDEIKSTLAALNQVMHIPGLQINSSLFPKSKKNKGAKPKTGQNSSGDTCSQAEESKINQQGAMNTADTAMLTDVLKDVLGTLTSENKEEEKVPEKSNQNKGAKPKTGQNSSGATCSRAKESEINQQGAMNTGDTGKLTDAPKQVTRNEEHVINCRDLMYTFLKIASGSNMPPRTFGNVKELIQGLVDGRVLPEAFDARIRLELKAHPNIRFPRFVPFLQKCLPLLQQSMLRNEVHIDGVKPPPSDILCTQGGSMQPVEPKISEKMKKKDTCSSASKNEPLKMKEDQEILQRIISQLEAEPETKAKKLGEPEILKEADLSDEEDPSPVSELVKNTNMFDPVLNLMRRREGIEAPAAKNKQQDSKNGDKKKSSKPMTTDSKISKPDEKSTVSSTKGNPAKSMTDSPKKIPSSDPAKATSATKSKSKVTDSASKSNSSETKSQTKSLPGNDSASKSKTKNESKKSSTTTDKKDAPPFLHDNPFAHKNINWEKVMIDGEEFWGGEFDGMRILGASINTNDHPHCPDCPSSTNKNFAEQRQLLIDKVEKSPDGVFARIRRNPSAKSESAAEKSKAEKKSKEPVKQSKPPATDSTGDSHHGGSLPPDGEDVSQPQKGFQLRLCSNCHKQEPAPKVYRKCLRCKEQGVLIARYYCGKTCQGIDWKERHKVEHKEQKLLML